ncbi:MAG TPA: hypothetical protein PKA88_14270 [Polyangiaceae bacterium]|nr:hypothetical protein [Polyangiaceae bacterium]
MAAVVRGGAAILCALACGACSRDRIGPPRGSHLDIWPSDTAEFPPPPARAEVVSTNPGGKCVWLDGHYHWEARRWEWKPGGWLVPPEGCHYAAPSLTWSTGRGQGALLYTPPRWYPKDTTGLSDQEILSRCAKPVVCSPPARPYKPR